MIMSLLRLRNPGCWESMKLVQHYAQMVDNDLLRESKGHSPVDSLSNGS